MTESTWSLLKNVWAMLWHSRDMGWGYLTPIWTVKITKQTQTGQWKLTKFT